MEKVVKVSKDGASIDFFQSEKIPVSPKKFRNGPELEGFYRFIFENDLRREALAIIDRIFVARKIKKTTKPAAMEESKMDPKQALKKAAKDAAAAKLAPVKIKIETIAKSAKKTVASSTKKPATKTKKTPAKKTSNKKSGKKKK